MPTMELHRGRLLDHVQLVVANLAASRRFYDAIFAVLGVPLRGPRTRISGMTNSSSPRPTGRKPPAS